MTTNLIIQYTLVGIILLAATVWIIWKLIKMKKNGAKSCCGCSLSESCGKKSLKKDDFCRNPSGHFNNNNQ